MAQETPIYEDGEALNPLRAEIMTWAREGRDARLSATDYVFLPDVTVTQEYKDLIIRHRAVLRVFPVGFSALLSGMTEDELITITPQSIVYPE